MVKFIERFEKHREITKAIYIPKNLHLTIFHDEKFDNRQIKRIVLKELNASNLRNSVETLSVYPEAVIDVKNIKTCRKIGGIIDEKTGKCKIYSDGKHIFR